jgi:hypothetical protein
MSSHRLPRRAVWSALVLIGTVGIRHAYADPPATPDEARALAERAAAHMRAVGPEKAIADFSCPTGGFMDRELVVVVYSPDHKIITSAGLPSSSARTPRR